MAKTIVLKKAKKPVRRAVNRDPVILTYRALAPLLVADADMLEPGAGESTHYRRFGDYVPEAAQWKRIGTYLITKQLEQVHINQSELDLWWDEYRERIAQEDEEKFAASEVEAELLELQRRQQELEAKLGKAPQPQRREPDFNAEPDRRSQPLEEKIDLGGVRRKDGGFPAPVQIPGATRAPLPQSNAADIRQRPTLVRRAVRKKA